MFEDYDYFKSEILKIADIDLNYYQENQMKRRIDTMIRKKSLSSYAEYIDLISKSKEELNCFIDYITINVSDFFRTTEHWHYLEDNVLSELSSRNKRIRIWSAACATGEEPYSLVISIMEKYPTLDFEILATDIDSSIIEKAKRGRYPIKEMEKVPSEIRDKYFIKKDFCYEIKEIVKTKVNFMKLDLLKFDYPKNFDLILARNILIYFTKEAKNICFKEFNESLCIGGYLFTGSTEQIIYYKLFNYKKIKTYLYKREI